MKHIHIFEIIRKKIISKNYKLFNENINNLIQTNEAKEVPEKCREKINWDCRIIDKLLLYFINTKLNSMNIFEKSNLSYDEYLSCIYFIIDYFEEIIKQNKINEEKYSQMQLENKGMSTTGNIIKISSDIMDDNMDYNINDQNKNETPHVKQEKFGVKKDINGNIIYPILISNNLRILNLGRIVHDNKNYHS